MQCPVVPATHWPYARGAGPRWCAGSEHVITSDGFFELEHLPKRVAVIGAGYIAVELAGVLAGLGAQVCLIIRKESVLRSFEPFLGQAVMKSLQDSGVTVYTNAVTAAINQCVL